MNLYSDRVALLGTENAFKIGPYIRQVEETGKQVIRCNLGEPDFPTPFFIKEEVKRQLDADNTHYVDPQGILPLREAVARHISETRQIKVAAEQVVIFPGAKPPIGFAQEVYLNPSDEVIYPSPGFPIYESFTRYLGAVPVPLQLSEEKNFSFGPEDLEKLITPKTKLIIINFPSNPTGGVASKKELEEIAAVIKNKCSPEVRVFSDEVYEDILFDGAWHYSIASISGMQEKTIIISGASKSYSWTGGRLGWAVFPTVEEAQVFKNLNINYFSCVPAYNQMGAKVAIESLESKKFISQMNASFQERRDMVVDGLNQIDGIKCQKPKGAFYIFPNIAGVCENLGIIDAYNSLPSEAREKTSPSTFFQMFLLFNYQVAMMDRRSFGIIGSEGQHYLRLSIATAKEDLIEAVKRIEQAAQDKLVFAKFFQKDKYQF